MFSNAALGVMFLMFLLFCVVYVVKRRSRDEAHSQDRARRLSERDELSSEVQRLEGENRVLRGATETRD